MNTWTPGVHNQGLPRFVTQLVCPDCHNGQEGKRLMCTRPRSPAMHPPCTSHASACTRHAPAMQPTCTRHAIDMHPPCNRHAPGNMFALPAHQQLVNFVGREAGHRPLLRGCGAGPGARMSVGGHSAVQAAEPLRCGAHAGAQGQAPSRCERRRAGGPPVHGDPCLCLCHQLRLLLLLLPEQLVLLELRRCHLIRQASRCCCFADQRMSRRIGGRHAHKHLRLCGLHRRVRRRRVPRGQAAVAAAVLAVVCASATAGAGACPAGARAVAGGGACQVGGGRCRAGARRAAGAARAGAQRGGAGPLGGALLPVLALHAALQRHCTAALGTLELGQRVQAGALRR